MASWSAPPVLGPAVGDATHELIHAGGCGLVALRMSLGDREPYLGMPVVAREIRLLDGSTPIPRQHAVCGSCGCALYGYDFKVVHLRKM